MKACSITCLLVLLCMQLSAQISLYPANQGMKWGMVDSGGEWKIPPVYDVVDDRYFGELLPFFYVQKGDKKGVFHAEKGEIIAPLLDSIVFIKPLHFEGYFWGIQDDSIFIWDQAGKKLFHLSDPYHLRLAGNKWAKGFINWLWIVENGDSSISKEPFEGIRILSGNLLVVTRDSQLFLADMEGKKLFPNPFQYVEIQDSNWVVGTREKGSEVFDLEGKLLLSFRDTFICRLTNDHIGYISDPEIRINQPYGLMDWDKNILTPPLYEDYAVDSSGYIWVKQNNLWGVLDKQKALLFPPTFSLPGHFDDRLAIVQSGNSLGIINLFGEMLAEPQYARIQLYDDMARLQKADESWQQIPFDSAGRPVRRMRLLVEGRSARQDVSPAFAGQNQQPFSAYGWFQRNGFWAWKHPESGEFVIKGGIRSVIPLPEKGITVIEKEIEIGRGSSLIRFALVDHKRGRWLTKPVYSHIEITDFDKMPVARVRQGDFTQGLLNLRGQAKLFGQVQKIGPFHHGLAVVSFREGKLAILRQNGSFVKPFYPKTISYLTSFEGGMAFFESGGKWGMVDSLLKVQLPPTYDSLYRLPGTELFVVSQNRKKFSYFNEEGHLLFEKNGIQSGDVHEGRFWIQNEEELFAFRDRNGGEITPFLFTRVNDFHGSMAAVAARGHGWGFIDREGNWKMKGFEHCKSFAYGLAPVRQKRRYGYLQQDGSWLIQPRYRTAFVFQAPGLAVVRKRRKYGVIDSLGQKVLGMRFQRMEIGPACLVAKKNGHFLYFDFQGKKRDSLPEGPALLMGEQTPLHSHLQKLKQTEIRTPSEGVTLCQSPRQYGLISQSGELLIPLNYDDIRPHEYGKTYILYGMGAVHYIDQKGGWIFQNQQFKP